MFALAGKDCIIIFTWYNGNIYIIMTSFFFFKFLNVLTEVAEV